MDELLHSFPDRYFQLWRYSVSHSSLLLRSAKLDDSEDSEMVELGIETVHYPSRIDILFKGVKGMHWTDTVLHGELKIYRVGNREAEISKLGFRSKSTDAQKQLFALDSHYRRSFVLSYGRHVHEDDAEVFDPGSFDSNFTNV